MDPITHTCNTCKKEQSIDKFYSGRYYICKACYLAAQRLKRTPPSGTNNTQENHVNLPDLTREQLIDRVASLEQSVVKVVAYLRDITPILDSKISEISQLKEDCAKKDEVIASFSSLNERVEDLEDTPPPVKRIVECAPESPKITTDKQLIYNRIKENKYSLPQLREILEEHGIYVSSKDQKTKSNFIAVLSRRFLELYPELTE